MGRCSLAPTIARDRQRNSGKIPAEKNTNHLAAGGAVGVLGGNLLAQRLGGPTLQRLFALMLVAVSFSLAAQKLYGG
ncbi:hypothetical protein AKG06_27800 [Pseudomonas aeruginosa]|nr:hypothetical protein AKG06_27800 [Pseudomonas aeruginosa]